MPEGDEPDAEMMTSLGRLIAGATAADSLSLAGVARRQQKLCARLRKFSFAHVAEQVAGLLTLAACQAASLRIEALLHLAALYCEGNASPTLAQIREWLNDILLKDSLGQGENAPDDVFVAIAASFAGSNRVFQGSWNEPAAWLQDLMAALLRLRGRPWAETALQEVTALLSVSEAVADRARAARYSTPVINPSTPIAINARTVGAGRHAVVLSIQDLFGLQIQPRHLAPFRYRPEAAAGLAEQALGHTDLERRPLLATSGGLVVVLPTAISAAARRHILESARVANELDVLADALMEAQTQEAMLAARNVGLTVPPTPPGPMHPAWRIWPATFDDGAYAVLVLIGDDLNAGLDEGLQGDAHWLPAVVAEVEAVEARLRALPDAQRGLTVLVRGGIGLGYVAGFGKPPDAWRRASLTLGDFVRMSWDHEFSATRVWKVLDYESDLPARGYQFSNLEGFLNLYGYLEANEFNLVPPELAHPGLLILDADYVTPLRVRVRQALDPHLVIGPDRQRWVEVQRPSIRVFFDETRDERLYSSPLDAMNGRLLACTETASRPWWITLTRGSQPTPNDARNFAFRIWDAGRSWLLRLVPRLEDDLPRLPDGPLEVRLEFPDLHSWTEQAALDPEDATRPQVDIIDNAVVVRSSLNALRAYSRAANDGERWLIAAIALGAARLAGEDRDLVWADALAEKITRSPAARFVHAIPSLNGHDMLQAALPLPPPRLPAEEDVAWSRLGLGEMAGRKTPGAVTEVEVGLLLQTAVLRLWERVRGRLQTLDRSGVVKRALINHDAIDRDRGEWKRTAAALLGLYRDTDNVLAVQADREASRGAAGMACRAIAEMAICVCPSEGGAPCGDVDLDRLVADLIVMLECANHCDAHFYKLAEGELEIAPNGSFQFDRGFLHSLHHPYLFAHQTRVFHDGADDYEALFERAAEPAEAGRREAPAGFLVAVQAEFGMSAGDLVNFSFDITEEALLAEAPLLILRKSELVDRMSGGDRADPVDVGKAYAALTLKPRLRWDDPEPEGAKARDWQPWRMNRKLSLVRRPLVQLDDGEDPQVAISPMLLDRAVRRVFQTVDGRLPAEAFDTRAMGRWIGTAVNERGHAFNHLVAARFVELGYQARADVNLTELGGGKALGDIDVLAWSAETAEVWLIECKRLLLDRTVGEIGERLADYAEPGMRKNKRTAIQKHLDRIEFIKANPGHISRVTGIPVGSLRLQSALVTDGIVPMQFSARMASLVTQVSDYRGLEAAFLRSPVEHST